MLTLDDLRGIADELRCNAESLRDGHTLRGEWHDNDARREHDKLIAWADAMSHHFERDLEMVGLQCVADIRAAVGDNGQMMQSELVERIAGLARDAARYRWLRDNTYGLPPRPTPEEPHLVHTDRSEDWRSALDNAIDAAMAKEAE